MIDLDDLYEEDDFHDLCDEDISEPDVDAKIDKLKEQKSNEENEWNPFKEIDRMLQEQEETEEEFADRLMGDLK